ncbi:calcium:proton antiporter [uncultured Corynebacterium sp.]|uniref:calcium:proton antiporter n=1 Tax=uncultured Corynebacterium sp. TaxID=159447 RepID=UPI0025DADDEE|nr:calcium:proton antiporter [uncultured Corynebacterium sp.]
MNARTEETVDRAGVRDVLDRPAVIRAVVGWAAVAATMIFGPLSGAGASSASLAAMLAAIVAVIAFASFGVVRQANHLAARLGDPYGSLVLTLSIVVIEVILISSVMLGPGDSETIARDSVMAVSMVIMNLVVGVALLAGAFRHGDLRLNSAGSSTYLAMIMVLITFALVLPATLPGDGTYGGVQQVVISVITIVVYAFFLLRQTTSDAPDYHEVGPEAGRGAAPGAVPESEREEPEGARADEERVRRSVGDVVRDHRTEVLTRVAVLLITVLPIVLLSHDLAVLVDEGLVRLDAPAALAGLLIAMIVFLPEGMTAIQAGRAGEVQRVMNLCHGALVSTVGLTIPAVLTIGALTGQKVVLAESLPHIVLLTVSVLLAMTTVGARRIGAGHGAAHLALFAAYAMTVFA